MSYTQDLHEEDVFTVLRAFILDTLGAAVNDVIRIPNNRVPMPKTFPFITLSERMKTQIHWPIPSISDPAVQPQTNSILSGIQYEIQVDAYGPTSGDLIQMLYTVLWSPAAFDFFNSQIIVGVCPLYPDPPHQAAIVDGEAEYELRWIMPVHLQYSPTLQTTIQTAATVTVGTITQFASFP